MLNADNCVAVWQAATFHRADQLLRSAEFVLLRDYDTVSKTSDFSTVLPASLQASLKSNYQHHQDQMSKWRSDEERRRAEAEAYKHLNITKCWYDY